MNALRTYGSLLLASRMRKVGEALYSGVDEIYRRHGVDLPARCFPILFLLRDQGRLGISELALKLGQSHPAVSQMSRKLLQHGVIAEWPDPEDERRRLLSLSRRGAGLMRRLEPVWKAVVEAIEGMEAARPLSAALDAVDEALEQRGFAARIQSRLHPAGAAAEILPFERRHAPDFKRLNLEWLEKYFRVEPLDRRLLAQPQRIVAAGGAIFMARLGRAIVGTCALINDGKGRFELAKMAVTAGVQGLGIGAQLLQAAIQAFADRAGTELILETSSLLRPAIAMYESAGFVRAARPGASEYRRTDVYMVYRGPLPARRGRR